MDFVLITLWTLVAILVGGFITMLVLVIQADAIIKKNQCEELRHTKKTNKDSVRVLRKLSGYKISEEEAIVMLKEQGMWEA